MFECGHKRVDIFNYQNESKGTRTNQGRTLQNNPMRANDTEEKTLINQGRPKLETKKIALINQIFKLEFLYFSSHSSQAIMSLLIFFKFSSLFQTEPT